jgi:Zn-finger nucleic acid-binding protein
MNCPNCGAAMALPESGPVWECGHCGTMVRVDPGAIDGVQLESGTSSAYQCPVCHQPLAAATIDHRQRVDACAVCTGLLMPLRLFATTVIAKRRAAATRVVVPRPASTRDLDRHIACPNCGETMVTDWYYGPGNVVIDRCEPCELVWLDGGELQRVIDAPGPDKRA